MQTLSVIFALPATVILLYFIIRDFAQEVKSKRFLKEKFWVILSIPALVCILLGIASTDFNTTVDKRTVLIIFSIVLAGLISLFWLIYLTWLDIYEREKKRYLLMVFVLSCFSTFLVFPISSVINNYGFIINGGFWNDFLYCVFAIGYVEELVKFLPWFIMWRFSRQLNEPFDFILYASVSALGFAFIENCMYLYNSGLTVVFARALYSSVAHMFFSSSIAYALVWWEYKGYKVHVLVWIGALLLGALGHGFYDFWLIRNEYGLEILTMIFFLASLHTWVIMKNNLINISTFYRPGLKLNAHLFMYRLISLMLIVLAVALMGYDLLNGSKATRNFLNQMAFSYAYIFAYITISFSSFQIVKGYIRPLSFPQKFFLPKIIKFPDFSGQQVLLMQKGIKAPAAASLKSALIGNDFNLKQRSVIDGVANAYHIQTNWGVFLLQFVKLHPNKKEVWQVVLMQAKDQHIGINPQYKQTDLKKMGYLLAHLKRTSKS